MTLYTASACFLTNNKEESIASRRRSPAGFDSLCESYHQWCLIVAHCPYIGIPKAGGAGPWLTANLTVRGISVQQNTLA
ncbi:MAG: hypothetical protein M3Y68_16195, partial [Chloroflexota bacterium]|nr:hypothetical protein [Chloroflexota bacterium]